MISSASHVQTIVEKELEGVADPVVATAIRASLVPPEPHLRDWDYGPPGKQFLCWTVAKDGKSRTGIAYCEHGFGPASPWGLVDLEGNDIGMDCAWFGSLAEAFLDSFLASDRRIWSVVEQPYRPGHTAFQAEALDIRRRSDPINWPEQWAPIRDHSMAQWLQVELVRELSPGHQLFGLPLQVIGRKADSDDVLIAVQDGSGRVATVHLTWKGSTESPPWPNASIYERLEAWEADVRRTSGDGVP